MSFVMIQPLFGVVRPERTQNSLLSYRSKKEPWNVVCNIYSHYTSSAVDNKDCAFVDRIWFINSCFHAVSHLDFHPLNIEYKRFGRETN